MASLMPCYYPMRAEKSSTGVRILGSYREGEKAGWLSLPCGRCIGCRLERSRQWATRIMFEAQLHDACSFLTLTYDDENMPFPPSLQYKHFQDFMKRLREPAKAVDWPGRKLRFFMCGEYGDLNWRPHYHAAIFGEDFRCDRVVHGLSGSGDRYYTSRTLSHFWPYGFSYVANLEFDSAAYIARYVTKKVTGDLAQQHYSWTDVDSGEVFDREPEFCHMSLKPGIGSSWFDLYSSDVYAGHDYVVVNGKKCKPPRYFDKLLERADPSRFQEIKDAREVRGFSRYSENVPERLVAKETVKRAALKQLKPRGDL